jgi:calcineurin-like phosphoesterase family protein
MTGHCPRAPRLATRALLAGLVATALLATGCDRGSNATPTEPEPETGNAVTLWAVGDGPNGKEPARAVARLIARGKPDSLLYLGDVYGDYAERFDDAYGEVGLVGRTLPTPGNHDWPNGRGAYLDYWAATMDDPPPTYYARTMAGWQILSLNSEEPVERGSRQYQWLVGQLTGAGTCRLAFWHRPRFSAGRHGDQQDVADIWEALSGRAALVLNGHDHTMQQFKPIDGVTELVSGAGGRSHYSLDAADPRLSFADNTHDGALSLTLTPGRATFRFVAVGGETLHRGTATCRPS